MDWSKAKSILIITFLVLNVFLLINTGSYYLSDDIPQKTVVNVEKILRESGITLKPNIPNNVIYDTMITYGVRAFNRVDIIKGLLGQEAIGTGNNKEVLYAGKRLIFEDEHTVIYKNENPTESIASLEKTVVEELVQKFIEKLGLTPSEYFVDEYLDNSANNEIQLTFRQRFNDYIIFDNYVKAVISKDGVKYIECKFKEPRDINERESKVPPIHAILLKHFAGMDKTVITDIDIGFKGYNTGHETKELIDGLTWRIRTGDGAVRYFRAVSGEELFKR
ncbi:MAG: two-component system regulatory protein YycI [Clostridia bacterium]|nr:two-component system regulatory protein YycI [Clostridia bacterium]